MQHYTNSCRNCNSKSIVFLMPVACAMQTIRKQRCQNRNQYTYAVTMATYIGATPAGGHLNSSHGRDCAKIPLRIICPTRRNLKNCVPPYGHKTTKNIQLLIFKWSRNLDKTNNSNSSQTQTKRNPAVNGGLRRNDK